MTVRRPLQGLRVVEVGIALAGPFAGSLLAEFGAHVIKVEKPGGGDPMRLMGPKIGDVAVWWGVAARAKHCVDLDLKNDEHKQVFCELIAQADVLVENYRPGVLERLGLGWPTLHALNPRLVMLSISGFGQTGPMSERPGFGKIAEAMSGIVALTGAPDETPMHIGFSLADTATGLMGTLGLALALFHRDVAGGSGTRIDVALYEPLFRMAECQLALCERLGRAPMREGTNDPYGWGASGRAGAIVPMQCADGHWIMVREASIDASDGTAMVAERVASLTVGAAMELLRDLRVKAAQIQDGATIASSEYFVERGDAVRTRDERAGDLVVPGEIPKRPSEPKLQQFRAVRPDEDRAVLAWARRREVQRAASS